MSFGRFGKGVSAIGSIVLILLYGVPLLWLLLTSLKSPTELDRAPNAVLFRPSFAAYQAMGSQILVNIARSAEIAVGTAVLSIVLGVLAVYGLSHLRGRLATWTVTVAIALLLLLQIVPQPTAVIPVYEVLAEWHLNNTIPGLILADSATLLPLATLLLRPFFLNVPRELEEAARIDGARPLGILRRVVLPLVGNGVFTVGALVFMIAWGEFIYAITFLSSVSLFPVSVVLALQVGQQGANWGELMALAVVTSIPVLVAFLASWRGLREGMMIGAVR